MKTLYSLFVAAFVLFTSASFAQNQTTIFEGAYLTKGGDGAAFVQLTWKKGTENTAYYLVERSTNGVDFKQVALVFTSEDIQFSDYKFRDRGFAAAGNMVYYRIAIVGEQKELTYLPTQKIDLASSTISGREARYEATVTNQKWSWAVWQKAHFKDLTFINKLKILIHNQT